MTDTSLTVEAKRLLHISVMEVLTAKGVSATVAERTADDIAGIFDEKVSRYLKQVLLDHELAVVQNALAKVH